MLTLFGPGAAFSSLMGCFFSEILPYGPHLASLGSSVSLTEAQSPWLLFHPPPPSRCFHHMPKCSPPPAFSPIPKSSKHLCLLLLNPGFFSKGGLFLAPRKALQTPKASTIFSLPPILSPSPPFCSFLLKAQLPKQETPFILSPFYVTLHLSPRQLVVPLNPPSRCHPQSQPAHCVSPVLSHPEPPKLVSLTQLLPLQPILEFYLYSTIWPHLSHVSKPPVAS